MGVRESLNQHSKLVAGVVAGVLVIVFAYIFFTMGGGGTESGPSGGFKAFFSTDGGKTWFPDDAAKIAPFTKDGKEAYRAYVYKCPDGKTFVSHLERFTAEAKKTMEAAKAGGPKAVQAVPFDMQSSGIEVKAPGQATWVNQADPRAGAIMTPKCAGGNPELVTP
jgi:hypothetical protein